ncbi:tetratricopeptide repeat protein [Paraburkholderia sediminicola]|uniref:tetratricopeptide repeat protein n=1 Tax=Paraburkholderia sediminicola TaxID=458836 RepID=UPI0038BAFF36
MFRIPRFNDDDTDVDALIARADAHFSARRMTEAIVAYRQVLSVRPRDAHALHRMGLACVHTNDMERARGCLEQALQAAPDRAELWEHAGLLAALAGKHESAEAFYRRAISLAGSTASLHRNLGDCLRQSGHITEAMTHYETSIEIEPGLHHAIRALARIHAQLGRLDSAAHYWRRAWTLEPASLNDGLGLIAVLAKSGRTHQLANAITQIRTRFAGDVNALKALAFVLNTNDRFNDALRVARQGLAIDPHHPLLHHNAARALSICGKIAESLPHSMEAARLLPDNPHMQFHLAGVLLGLGEFEEGWKRYRGFYDLPERQKEQVRPIFREWNGEPIAGCRFLLVGEQGLGDEVQFIRFAEWLHRQEATIDVLVSRPIADLAACVTGVHAVFTTMPSGPYDYWCYMLRIPEHIKLDISMLPVAMPYLRAPPDKLRQWRDRIDAISSGRRHANNRRVGVVWAGSPNHVLDRYRSILLDTLKPLFELAGVTWYSVQKGDRERESEGLAHEYDLHTLGPAINDFTDTLAILQTLDLLITVDTSVAHLAGAAGFPVWVVVPAYSEWRWLTGRTDSPWYPSMRLFRQRELGEWNPVVEEVQAALQLWRDAPAARLCAH